MPQNHIVMTINNITKSIIFFPVFINGLKCNLIIMSMRRQQLIKNQVEKKFIVFLFVIIQV